jgi:hypothetical protein
VPETDHRGTRSEPWSASFASCSTLVLAFVSPRAALVAENLILRQQLIVIRRQIKRPHLRRFDRWLIGALAGRFHRLLNDGLRETRDRHLDAARPMAPETWPHLGRQTEPDRWHPDPRPSASSPLPCRGCVSTTVTGKASRFELRMKYLLPQPSPVPCRPDLPATPWTRSPPSTAVPSACRHHAARPRSPRLEPSPTVFDFPGTHADLPAKVASRLGFLVSAS